MSSPSKICTRCGGTEALSDYAKDKRNRDGHEFNRRLYSDVSGVQTGTCPRSTLAGLLLSNTSNNWTATEILSGLGLEKLHPQLSAHYWGAKLDEFMREIDAAIEGNAWKLALTGTLALPDICAALESDNGETSGAQYKAWVTKWIGPKYEDLDANELWKMRCSMLHQGRTKTATYERIIFVAPSNRNCLHKNIIDNALNLDLPTFCNDVMEAVREWAETMDDDENYARNQSDLIRWYPEGLPPYIVGTAVLS